MDAHTECAKGRPISIGSWRIIFVGSQLTGQVSALIDSNNNHTGGRQSRRNPPSGEWNVAWNPDTHRVWRARPIAILKMKTLKHVNKCMSIYECKQTLTAVRGASIVVAPTDDTR